MTTINDALADQSEMMDQSMAAIRATSEAVRTLETVASTLSTVTSRFHV